MQLSPCKAIVIILEECEAWDFCKIATQPDFIFDQDQDVNDEAWLTKMVNMKLWQGKKTSLVEKYENELDTESIQCGAKKQIKKVQQHASIQVVHAILYGPPAQTHKTPTKLTTQTHKKQLNKHT